MRRKHRRPKFVYVLQGPPGPPGQVGQPGQVGRDGRDGQAPQLTKALEDVLKTQKTNWDTTVMIWKEFLGYQIFLLYLSNKATTLVVHGLRF